jgi:hypothetical protein
MTLETAVGQKLITEDGKNGLPVRLVDANGNALSTTIRTLVRAAGATGVSGNSGNINTAGYRQIMALINLTAISGTSPTISWYLKVSDDGGTTFYTVLVTGNLTTPGQAVLALGPGIANGGAAGPSSIASAGLVVTDVIQIGWTVGGTAPSANFTITLIGQ